MERVFDNYLDKLFVYKFENTETGFCVMYLEFNNFFSGKSHKYS